MKVLGIDPSVTSTGIAIARGDQGKATFLHTSVISPKIPAKANDADKAERLSVLRRELISILDTHEPDLVVLEGYSFGSKGRATYTLGEWGGVLRLTLFEKGYPFIIVFPPRLKKFAAGAGQAKKDAIVEAANKEFNSTLKLKDNDIADAMYLAYFGLHVEFGLSSTPWREEIVREFKGENPE